VIVSALPGAGKTTRVAPALAADGPVLLLQPRRVAARAIAQRIATEQGWTVGREVGWHVRFDRRTSAATRLTVATEGIVTARLQQDPLLSDVRTLVIDEFHERTIHADLALTLAMQTWRARDDFRIVVMSATLDTARVAAFLTCPIVRVPGRVHPVSLVYAPGQSAADAVRESLRATHGDVLCFLPGAAEIRRTARELQPLVEGSIDLRELHGSLDSDAQDAALRGSARRGVVLATNIAETSLTVPRITAVVDTGLHKISRYDSGRAIDSLELERIPQDSADQRAGRAGRTAPGVARRLWSETDRLVPHREPEIARVDLSGAALDVIAWGGDPNRLEWFEPPPADRLESALALLTRLGAVRDRRLTPLGDRMQRVGLHPRLARILVTAHGARDAARICALLSERHFLAPRTASTSSDLLSVIDNWDDVPAHVRYAADQLEQRATAILGIERRVRIDEPSLRRALADGYPDRIAKRRADRSPRVLLASGHGAVIGEESGVRDGEFIVAIDVQAATRSAVREARIRIASRVEREWLTPTRAEVKYGFDASTGTVRAIATEFYDALPLSERHVDVEPERAAPLLAAAFLERPLDEEAIQLMRRLRFAGVALDLGALVERSASHAARLSDIDLLSALTVDERRILARDAPATLRVPSGREVPLEYEDTGGVSASVKLQELFGLADTPRVGGRAEPVTLHLLAPSGRPVQVTRDLRSFWNRTYPELRTTLRARYPKHPWPDDPWTAPPTWKANARRAPRV
jgi:ATP-dependent helicase HrpB